MGITSLPTPPKEHVVGVGHHQMHSSADLKSLGMACEGVCGKFPGFGHQRAIICALDGNMCAEYSAVVPLASSIEHMDHSRRHIPTFAFPKDLVTAARLLPHS